MQLQTTSPESKFPNEYIGAIFIPIDFEKVIEKIQRGPNFMEHGVYNENLLKFAFWFLRCVWTDREADMLKSYTTL